MIGYLQRPEVKKPLPWRWPPLCVNSGTGEAKEPWLQMTPPWPGKLFCSFKCLLCEDLIKSFWLYPSATAQGFYVTLVFPDGLSVLVLMCIYIKGLCEPQSVVLMFSCCCVPYLHVFRCGKACSKYCYWWTYWAVGSFICQSQWLFIKPV